MAMATDFRKQDEAKWWKNGADPTATTRNFAKPRYIDDIYDGATLWSSPSKAIHWGQSHQWQRTANVARKQMLQAKKKYSVTKKHKLFLAQ